MVAERQYQSLGKAKVFILICAVAVVLSGSCLFAVEQGAAPGAARYRVFPLKHISAEQGKKYLAEAGVGTVSQLPGLDTLLVTAQLQELIKASAILGLVDAEELFYIKAIFPASEVENLPSNEQIAAEVGDISIGTFSEPPTSAAKTKAIIDVHGNAVIAVAPAEQLKRIISAIERLQSTEAQALRGSEPNKSAEMDEATSEAEAETATEAELKRIAPSFEPTGRADEGDDESDKLFNKLLKSIAEANETKEGRMEAEEKAVEQAQQPSQPSAVAPALAAQTAAGVPDAKEPNKPSVDSKQTEESAFQATEEPQSAVPGTPDEGHLTVEPNLPAVGSLDKDAAEKPKSEPSPKRVSYEPKPIAGGNETLQLDLPERLDIIDLVDLVGKYLQLDYMYDETKVRGEVALRLQGPIKIKDLYPLLESVLKFRGFVMTRRGNLVTIAPADEAVGLDPVLHPEVGEVQFGDVAITRVFKLKHIDTSSAENLLKGMKLGVDISPIAETGTLIITGYAYRMGRIEELLQMVDKPGEPRQFRFRQLKYTMATTLAPKIKTLAEQLGTVSITIAAPAPTITRRRGESTAAFRARQQRAAATATAAPGKAEVYLDADERTNRILMIGLEEQLAVVDSLIDSLDVEQQDLRTLRLYDIQHVGAEEVVKKLKELDIIGAGAGRETAGTRISRPSEK
jgi:type II secretory pathway component GspD/PulD (secretin)